MNLELLVALGFAGGVLLAFAGLDLIVQHQKIVIGTRLGRYAVPLPRAEPSPGAAQEGIDGLNNRISQRMGPGVGTELARADLHLTVPEYVLINLATTLVGFLLGLAIFRGILLMGLVGGIAGFLAPRAYVLRLQQKRIVAFNRQLGDTLVLLANSLRTGYSLLQSIETVVKELPPPASLEFARVTREVGLGMTLHEALASLLRRVPSEDMELVITAINIHHEVGGNLATVLDTIAETIRERVRIMNDIRTLTSQQRLSANILSLLPVGLALVLFALNPGYISRLWKDSCGLSMLAVGTGFVFAGYLVVRRVAAIRV